jgi:hypothetical protein
MSITDQIAACDRVAALFPDDPTYGQFMSRQRKILEQNLVAWKRFERRHAESTKLTELLPRSQAAALEQLNKIAEHGELKIIGRPEAMFLHLATLDLAVLTVALRVGAPVALFKAFFYLPLALSRFAIAKGRYVMASRRAHLAFAGADPGRG